MKRYTLRVNCVEVCRPIWSGDDMSEAIRMEAIAIKHWGRDNVWIADAVTEILVG